MLVIMCTTHLIYNLIVKTFIFESKLIFDGKQVHAVDLIFVYKWVNTWIVHNFVVSLVLPNIVCLFCIKKCVAFFLCLFCQNNSHIFSIFCRSIINIYIALFSFNVIHTLLLSFIIHSQCAVNHKTKNYTIFI